MINRTRIAILGTLAELHRQPIRYDLQELRRIVLELQPDLLCVEIERDALERGDWAGAPLEVREALVPLARCSDIVILPMGAASAAELRAFRSALVGRLDALLAWMLSRADNARAVNSALVGHTCGFICELEARASGEAGRRAWVSNNEKMLANIEALVARDPERRVLVAVQCRRKHWLEARLRRVSMLELVPYWQL